MTDKLPPNLLALFTPRPPLRYLPHADHASGVRHTADISGVAQFMPALKEYAAVDQYEPTESWLQRRDRIRAERREKNSGRAKECSLMARSFYPHMLTSSLDKPMEDAKKRGFGDPYRTLFVARLNYSTEVKDLEREFGRFGPIERVSFQFYGYDVTSNAL
jgi:U1 small nuclear ribonucleoprotein 70kDa